MNMFQLQERIKDFSKDQLVREMQQPSGVVPPFLVLSELQRRTRMEKAFQADQAQGQQSTVAQDAINAAGVPQGGIADMAQAMAPQTDMSGNTGAMPVQNMYGGGEVKRMQPGGLASGARSTGNAELDAALAELERARLRREEVLRGLQEDEEGLSGVSADVGSFTPAALSAPAIGADAGPLSRIDANIVARTAPGLPSIRPTDAQPILNERAPPAFSDIAPPATILGPEQGPNFPSVGDAARMRALNVTPGAGGFPSQSDLDMRFVQEQRDAAALAAATAGQTPDPTSIIMSDGIMSPIDDRPTPIADAFRAELAGRDARAAEAARMMAINELPELSTFDPFEYMRGGTEAGPAVDPFDPAVNAARIERELQNPDLSAAERQALESQLAGVRRFYDTVQGAEGAVADAYALIGRGAGFGIEKFGDVMAGLGFPGIGAPAIEFGQTVTDAMDPFAERGFIPGVAGDLDDGSPLAPTTPIVPLTPDADTPRPVPRPDRGTTPPGGGGGGTGGGAGGGAGARATGAADADKWLALAQFGLGLMSSQQPTLGGAIGEAGTAALSQLRESQKEAYERDLAERTLAARSASRPDRLSLSDRLDYITDQMENTRLAISMEVDPGRKLDLANDLASLQAQAAAILGTAGPATARAAEGATDVRG